MKTNIFEIQSLVETALDNLGPDLIEEAYEKYLDVYGNDISNVDLKYSNFKLIKNNKIEFIFKDKIMKAMWVKVVLNFEDLVFRKKR